MMSQNPSGNSPMQPQTQQSSTVPSPQLAGPGHVLQHQESGADGNDVVSPVPNPNAVKLFVGRFPSAVTDQDLTDLFKKHAIVEEFIRLRAQNADKATGCAFVKVGSVEDAVNVIKALNGKFQFAGYESLNIGTIQVQFATGEIDRLGIPDDTFGTCIKLFVGSIPKGYPQEELKALFEKYGAVNEVFIIEERSGQTGYNAAFVRMDRTSDGNNAINALSKKHTLQGADKPLEVRIADTKDTRQQHKSRRMGGQMGMYPGVPMGFDRSGGNMMGAAAAAAAYGRPPYGGHFIPHPPPPRTIGAWTEYRTTDHKPYYYNNVTNETQWDPPAEFRGMAAAGMGMPPAPYPGNMMMSHAGAGGVGQGEGLSRGPSGANIFVFHVPNEWTDQDLLRSFEPFGRVVSYSVAKNPATKQNRGFGFVSYDNLASAASAIEAMNGFQVANGRRLKVQVKKGEENASLAAMQQQHQHHYMSHPQMATPHNMPGAPYSPSGGIPMAHAQHQQATY